MRRPLLQRLVLVAGLAWSMGCGDGDGTGTFVRVKLTGTVSQAAPIRSIALDLRMGGATSSTTFEAPSQADIKLPTDAILEIGAGEGTLVIAARALAADGTVLGTGVGSGDVIRNRTTEIPVVFGGAAYDAGIDAAALDGAHLDSAIDATGGPGLDTSKDTSTVDMGADRASVSPVDLDEDVPATGGVSGAGGAGGAGSPAGGSGGTSPDSGAGGVQSGTGGTSSGGGGAQTGSGGSGTGGLGPDAAVTSHRLTASPLSLDFGVVVPGTTSPTQSLTISNDGDAASPPLVVSLAGGKGFVITQDRCTGVTLGLNEACTLTLAFTPATAGIMQQDGAVGAAGETGVTFHLNGAGAGTKAELLLTPSAVDFRQVDVGTSASADFTLRNIGTADAGTITVGTSASPAFRITNDSCGGKSLAGQGSCFFTLVFTPTTYGPAAVAVTATSSSGLSAAANVIGIGRDFVAVTVLFAGNGSGTVTGLGLSCASSAGTCSLNVPRTDASAVYAVLASAGPGSTFTGWSGAGCLGTGPCSISLTAPSTVTATFELPWVQLSVAKTGSGAGTVTSDLYGIACGATCSANVPASTTITLTATADTGSSFVGWTGGGCSGVGPCVVTVSSAMTVTAEFVAGIYTVGVTKTGTGSGTVQSSDGSISCGTVCSASLEYGDTITLNATPDDNSTFSGWSDSGCTGTGPCTVNVTAATTITAKFMLKRFTLVVKLEGTGEGKVASDPGKISCGEACSGEFEYGTEVTLTPTWANGSAFAGWAGPRCKDIGPCTVRVTTDITATAIFNTGFSCSIIGTARSCVGAREYPVGASDFASCRAGCESALQRNLSSTGCWTFNPDGKCVCTTGVLTEGGTLWGGACGGLPRL